MQCFLKCFIKVYNACDKECVMLLMSKVFIKSKTQQLLIIEKAWDNDDLMATPLRFDA